MNSKLTRIGRILPVLTLLSAFLALPTWAACTLSTPVRGDFQNYIKAVCTGTLNGTTAVTAGTIIMPFTFDGGTCTAVVLADTGTGTPILRMFPSGLGTLIDDTGSLYIDETMPAVDTPTVNGSNETVPVFDGLVSPTAAHLGSATTYTLTMDSSAASDGTFTITCYFHLAGP